MNFQEASVLLLRTPKLFRMELGDLHIFKTVADEGGIIRAARKLHRVQSSVSTRIRQLESSLGTELFHREGQRLTLSSSGDLLLGYADKLLRLAEEARSAVSGSPPAGVLKLGALESTAASRLPQILATYHRAHPNVSIELTTGTNDALTAAVAERRLDAAFVAEKPSNRELSSMALFTERLVIISSRGHHRIGRPQDIEGESVIAFPNGCAYRRVLQRWMGAKRLSTVPIMELSSYHAILACVASGAGVALVPESVLATMRHDDIAAHPLPKVYAQVITPLIWRSAGGSLALSALQQTLRSGRAITPPARRRA
jgi:DNA-binding transcriptional LysR family regulator